VTPSRPLRALAALVFACVVLAGSSGHASAADFSARLDALWDFDHPAHAFQVRLPAAQRDSIYTENARAFYKLPARAESL